MIRALVAATGLVALAIATALAADLATKPMYSKAPAVAPVDNWSGFYIGAMGGYGKENTSDVGALSGGFAGGTAGYNWQTGAIVLGLEADAAWSDIGASGGIPGLVTVIQSGCCKAPQGPSLPSITVMKPCEPRTPAMPLGNLMRYLDSAESFLTL